MGNVGIVPGLTSSAWRSYPPRLRAFSTLTSIVQPILSDERSRIGRYLVTNQGLVVGQAQITFVTGDTFGSGEGVWGIRLPVPANRSSGGADLPIGVANLWQGSAANPSVNMVGQVTLMDPLEPAGAQGQEDSYAQVFISKLMSFGTATIPSGSTSVTVTHNLDETPNPYDVKIVPTNTPTTNPQWWSVQNCGATTFDIVVKTNPSTTGATFAWKIEAEPNSSGNHTFPLLMSSLKPWIWAAGHVIGLNFQYEARR